MCHQAAAAASKENPIRDSRRRLRRQTDASISRVLLEDTAIDDAFVDPRGLVSVHRDVADTVDWLLEQAKVELALAAEVVGDGIHHGHEGVVGSGEEDLDGAGRNVSASFGKQERGVSYFWSKSSWSAKL